MPRPARRAMRPKRHTRRWSHALVAGGPALLAAAAPAMAGEAGYGRVIVFGDSISDSGSYAAQAPAGAGRFTTNPDPVWVELVAAGVGLDLTSHAVGGTNYAEGGARVTVARPGGPGGITRTPVTRQIDRHLGAEATFASDSLVIVQGGGNDVFFTQSNGLDFTDADLQVLDMAAEDLAAQVQRLQAAGARTIVTTSVPKFEVFNSRYEAALAARPVNVLYVDVAALISEIEADPAAYGLVNITDPACRGRLVQSFDCLPADYVAPDANRTYLFADAVHFTGVIHEMQAGLVLAALRAPQMVSQLPYVAQRDARANAAILSRSLAFPAPPAGAWQVFGQVEADEVEIDGAPHRPGLDADAARITFVVERGLGDGVAIGGMAGFSEGGGDFGSEAGRFDSRGLGASVFARRAFGPVEARASARYHRTRFDDITRVARLAATMREEVGKTEAKVLGLAIEAQVDLAHGPWRLRPLAGASYEKVRVDGYAEGGSRSSQMSFGAQTVETLTISLGGELALESRAGLRPYVRATYEVDVLEQDRWINVTPSGAPVPFNAAAFSPEADYLAYEAGVHADLAGSAVATVGVRGVAGHSTIATTTGFLGLRLPF